MQQKVSIVIPTYNEEENIELMTNEVINEISKIDKYDYELIIIDNDSKDKTRDIIRTLCNSNKKIKAIFNMKNFGQFNSPYYGITQATGDCVIIISADFQEPVDMIPKLIAEWEKGYKIVLGQKTKSKESKILYALRSAYYAFMNKYSDNGFLKQVTGFGLYDKQFVEIMRQIDDPKPFLRGIITEYGNNIKTIEFEQTKRRAGKSSNNLAKYYDGAVQSITAYTKVGIRLMIVTGVLFTLLSVSCFIGCLVYKLINWNSWSIFPYLLDLIILFAISIQFLFLGILGEYILNINTYVRRRPIVVESERINFD